MIALSKKAAATLALFSACVANGFAASPTIQHVQAVSAIETPTSTTAMNQITSALMVNTQNTLVSQDLAAKASMALPLFQTRMTQVIGKLGIHLSKNEQATALNSMLTASFVGTKQAKAVLSALPTNNVVHELLSSTFNASETLGTTMDWSVLSSTISRNLPTINTQHLVASEGVATVKKALDHACGNITTSMSIGSTNTQCAASLSPSSEALVRAFNHENIRDGYLVGEFNGVPVLVSASGAMADDLANVKFWKDDAPFISISAKLANALHNTGNLDAVRLVLAHEYGHIEEHRAHGTVANYEQSTQNQIKDELDADHHAIEAMHKMGMDSTRIASAFDALKTSITATLGEDAMRHPFIQDMMAQRENQMHAGHTHAIAMTR